MSWIEWHRKLSRGEESGWDRLLLGALLPCSWAYRGYVALRNRRFDAGRGSEGVAGIPVVSIGGLAAGGTGKTPLTAHLANRLTARGHRPLVVTRGYAAPEEASEAALISSGASGEPAVDWRQAGEETILLTRLCGHCAIAVAHRREEALQVARERGLEPNLLLLDGGFQHRRLQRDLDIVTVDVSRHPGRGRLLPAGDLREPWSALRRAHHLILHRAESCPDREGWITFLGRHAPGLQATWSRYEIGTPYRLGSRPAGRPAGEGVGATAGPVWADLAARRIGVRVGIGAPESFLAALSERDVRPCWQQIVRDHAGFERADAADLLRTAASERLGAVLVTEKDAVKMESLVDQLPEVWVVPAEVILEDDGHALTELMAVKLG